MTSIQKQHNALSGIKGVTHSRAPTKNTYSCHLCHFENIANYFVAHQSSGFVEGLNNKIKVLKRRCDGIFRLDHLFQRITLDIQGYTLFG